MVRRRKKTIKLNIPRINIHIMFIRPDQYREKDLIKSFVYTVGDNLWVRASYIRPRRLIFFSPDQYYQYIITYIYRKTIPFSADTEKKRFAACPLAIIYRARVDKKKKTIVYTYIIMLRVVLYYLFYYYYYYDYYILVDFPLLLYVKREIWAS